MTLKQWRRKRAFTQGYVLYMQAALPGSPLAGVHCPYLEGTKAHAEFQAGQQQAAIAAQEGDD